jgi:hypothetical protein
MQDATCSLKAPSLIHHGWTLPTTPDLDHRTDEASPIPDASHSDMSQQDRQSGAEQSYGAVVSSLNRLSLSASDANSPSGLSCPPPTLMTSAVTSGYSGWPVDNDLFQSSSAVAPSLPNFPVSTSGIPGISTNGLHSPFSTSATQLQPSSTYRRAITGHPSIVPTTVDTYGAAASLAAANGGNRAAFTSWTNPNPAQTLNWLQQAGRPGPLPTRFGPVHHGRSMSVQNINMTGNSAAIPTRKSPNQYISRGGGGSAGIFGGLPASMTGYNGQQGARAPSFLPQLDQYGSRHPDIDEKSLLAGLSQDVASTAGLEAQWLDLIRSAVQDQVRGLSGASCGWPFNQQQFDHSRQSAKG